MSPIIEGCAITLKNKSLVDKVINNKTRIQDNKELDNFKLNQVSVQLNGLKPFEHYDYSAIPLIKNKKYALETKGTVAAHRKAGTYVHTLLFVCVTMFVIIGMCVLLDICA